MERRERINKYEPPQTNGEPATPEVAEPTTETLAEELKALEELGKKVMAEGYGGIIFPRGKLYHPRR
ncbi:hypothetical protein A3B45_05205 [Candidatus Daviesbacteria bacterium RIFCSPLOWO2_01_FULL_39_12]|uniref:Uncharacterized protein n=1 Tax=Candidatus Daviesbacteria bacterium RIFCSPLOWO2_01_FULL_39_12 TaxID=1797785 RepID=A0A1F5KUA9_9BACT|nr:MAG: hypothetical protein A3B45_05205 [Candidatus Daviesbacteria bacterium RIFCSPLOWO2_01_FULL_39_12]